MKPFDLQAAMRGEPVVTRDGRPYKFGAYNPDAMRTDQVIGWVDSEMMNHDATGKFDSVDESWADLFMASKKVTKWANLITKSDYFVPQRFWNEYRTKEEAEQAHLKEVMPTHCKYVAIAIPVEMEE